MQHPSRHKTQKAKKPKPHIPLLELLAINNTQKARELLQKYGKEDALSYADLEDKLAQLYATSKDKVELEMSFAEIHPHKDFILKYLAPSKIQTKVIIPENHASADANDDNDMSEQQSSCEGNPNCNCNKKSSFDNNEAIVQRVPAQVRQLNSSELVAIVGIVALVGFAYLHHSKQA